MEENVKQGVKKLVLENGMNVYISGRENGLYSTTEETVSAICSEILGLDVVDVSQSLIVLGADSLSLLEIVQEISDNFHIEIDTSVVSSRVTIIDIAELIEKIIKGN